MLPSLLTRDIQTGLRQYLLTAYEPSDAFFRGVMERFLNREGAWMKGPYLQIGLPFHPGKMGRDFFTTATPGFQTIHPAFAHQEAAWERLQQGGNEANTLVATGTGSGKTECFLYPILQRCAREAAAGRRGIKALILYPMNALATDQARRIADLIHTIPAFREVRAGLYVGGVSAAGGGTIMTADNVITDRHTLRTRPPDILLTNYKMLDYLLIRPDDRELWAQNEPDTLRYIVVDELHTFDGAQGTDLALLLRRLKARLKTTDNESLITHVGTSATLGTNLDTAPLRDYAHKVFGSPFPEESVITEQRRNLSEFLGSENPTFFLESRPGLAQALRQIHRSQEAAVTAWFPLFFPEEPVPADVRDMAWRQHLATLLKRHALFVGLLKAVQNGTNSLADLPTLLASQVPASVRPHLSDALDALLTLIAWARSPESPTLPFANLRVQSWLRELRRMVALLTPHSSEVQLRSESELAWNGEGIYLPLIQCAECHATAWLSRVSNLGENRLSTNLDEIYNGWFGHATETVRLYPHLTPSAALTDGIVQYACAGCGALNAQEEECTRCTGNDLVPVYRPTATYTTTNTNTKQTATYHDDTCPVCGTPNTLVLIGSRATTLGAQIVDQSWGSLFNDDRKLIAFSDSVQDAAHRAGFIGARTYIQTLRKAIARGIGYITETTDGTLNWAEFQRRFRTLWKEPDSPLQMDAARFVAEFIGPNMTWQRAWTDLYQGGGILAPDSPLIERVEQRLTWQTYAEFTYAGNRGRTLEKQGVATLAPATKDIEAAARSVVVTLREQFGLIITEPIAFWWLWGIVNHLRKRGALFDPILDTYPADGNLYKLTRTGRRSEWMPNMGPRTIHPRFLSLYPQKNYDSLRGGTQNASNKWYARWTGTLLTQQLQLLPTDLLEIIRAALASLEKVGVVRCIDLGNTGRYSQKNQVVYGLNPERLYLYTSLACLKSGGKAERDFQRGGMERDSLYGVYRDGVYRDGVYREGSRTLIVPAEAAIQLMGMPCPEALDTAYESIQKPPSEAAEYLRHSALRRVITAEHTGLLERAEREQLENRFKSRNPQPWFENLLSATPTLEMGVDIGDLSSVMLCSVPPTVASFLQRVGRAGRRDGNAHTTTLADGASPHDLYFFEEPSEMMAGDVTPPGVFLQAPVVLRRQFCAFCMDDWVATNVSPSHGSIGSSANSSLDLFPDKTGPALDAVDTANQTRFPYTFIAHCQKNRHRLFEAFIALLDDNADEEVRSRLQAFVEGNGETTPLHYRLLETFQEIAEERKRHKTHVQELRKSIRQLKNRPTDPATAKELEGLEQEQSKFQELIAEIDGRDLLNTMTDNGLIPNYAFPEAGVILKSVLWRRATAEDKTNSKYVSLRALRYERPAESALSEFAPENRFYANQRRVEIDQIDLDLAKLETWRLCPTCQHMQNLEISADAHPVCPRCQDAMWADTAQKRLLLRFRQAISNSDDTKVRIDDTAEDREPRTYIRQMLVDFTPESVREAWILKSASASTSTSISMAFGFEFIASAAFRDVNFGEKGKSGDKFKVAHQEMMRPGFRLCRRCGKVQSPNRAVPSEQEPDESAEHAFDCPARGSDAPENILQCLYLYREFQSEALRILVPFTRMVVDDSVVQSFSAAVQLGLKRRFGGQVNHLRVMIQETPDSEGGPRRCYLLLYDSVPGGTGYLHQLLAHDGRTLKEVFQMALAALEECPCQEDPDKDGCYRCVYQYRLGRSMASISRRIALILMRDLVASLDQLERTDTISGLGLNHALESVLESRFVESLRRLSNVGGLPPITLIQEIVNGREGYHLQVGAQKYIVEPQVNLNAEQAVLRPSRPDFLIRPLSTTLKRKPIAIFCDGWTFHREILREDAAKRTAILNSNRFWVWSVTMDDVEAAIQGRDSQDLASPYTARVNRPDMVTHKQIPLPAPQTFSRNGVAELLHWLASPCTNAQEDAWVGNAWLASQGWLMRLFPITQENLEQVNVANRTLRQAMPIWLPDIPAQVAEVGLPDEPIFNIHGVWHPPTHIAQNRAERLPSLVWFDDTVAVPDAERRTEWRWWLWAFNWLQTVPGALLVTRSGVSNGDYAGLIPAHSDIRTHASGQRERGGTDETSLSTDETRWEEPLNEMLESLRGEATTLMKLGASEPDEIGYVLIDESNGEELSMAEMVWHEKRIALLTPDYIRDREIWEAQNWQVVETSPGWSARVAMALRLASTTDEVTA